MNTLFQRPEGHLPLYANVGIKFGKRNICGGNSAGISNSFQLLSTVKMQGGEHINLRTNGSYVELFEALFERDEELSKNTLHLLDNPSKACAKILSLQFFSYFKLISKICKRNFILIYIIYILI